MLRSSRKHRFFREVSLLHINNEKEEALETFCQDILKALLAFTDSQFGYIGEYCFNGDGEVIKMLAISDITSSHSDHIRTGVQFKNVDSIIFQPVLEKRIVIYDQESLEKRGGFFPKYHHKISSFVSYPLMYGDRVVGVIGLANADNAYCQDFEKDVRLLSKLLAMRIELKSRQQSAQSPMQAKSKERNTRFQDERTRFVDTLEKWLENYSELGVLRIFVVDIDDFSELNERFGRDVANDVLLLVANGIRKISKLYARLDSNQYAFVVEGSQLSDFEVMASLKRHHVYGNRVIRIKYSAGVTIYPRDLSCASKLLRHAETSMYESKLGREEKLERFNNGKRAEQDRKQVLLERLQTAIARDELKLYFQPKIALNDRQTIGFEGLIRWERGGKVLPPNEFLPLVQELKLDLYLGEFVIAKALETLQRLVAQGRCFSISVNISSNHFSEDKFLERFYYLCDGYSDTVLSLLILEIVEDNLIANLGSAAYVLNKVRKLGVRIAIDDFGTGYSSMTYLQKLCVDEIKIDKSFVLDMLSSTESYKIVKSVIGLGLEMGTSVVAEGVESAEVERELNALGCHCVQGFLYSKPVPLQELLDEI